ncbi:unnamed protein product, partial [Scytosiphon promiscuus]
MIFVYEHHYVILAAWSLGAVLGPGVGGMLALPADNFPSIFSQDGVFGRYACTVVNRFVDTRAI